MSRQALRMAVAFDSIDDAAQRRHLLALAEALVFGDFETIKPPMISKSVGTGAWGTA
jgi:hypothetical protein